MTEAKKSTYTEAKKRANMKYARNNLKRIPLDVQLSKYEEIRAAATAAGETVNGYIKRAIDQRLTAGILNDPALSDSEDTQG